MIARMKIYSIVKPFKTFLISIINFETHSVSDYSYDIGNIIFKNLGASIYTLNHFVFGTGI